MWISMNGFVIYEICPIHDFVACPQALRFILRAQKNSPSLFFYTSAQLPAHAHQNPTRRACAQANAAAKIEW